MAKRNLFFDNNTVDMLLSVAAFILLLASIIGLFIIYNHTKLKSLVTSIALHIRQVGAVTK